MNGRPESKNGSAAPATATDSSADIIGDPTIADLEDPVIDEVVAKERAESANGNGGMQADDAATDAEPTADTEPEAKADADADERQSDADAEATPEDDMASEVDLEAEQEDDDASALEAAPDVGAEGSETEADEQARTPEPSGETSSTDSADADSTEPPAESPDRYGSPAVSEGLSRGTIPGQAEDPPPLLLGALVRPAVAVLTVCALLGLLAGIVREPEETVRREFIYTLDESVPDSFLREDRRLLTQVVTMQSDAVLAPVAEEHALTTDELRGRIDVETIDLSEVLRLEVRAADPQTARSISDAIIAQYLAVSAEGVSTAANEALLAQRAELGAELAIADSELQTLANEDVRLQTTEESLERQIDLTRLQIDRLQGLLDDGLANPAAAPGQGALRTELTAAEADLLALEGQLADVRVDRAEPTESATAEPALTRRVARLETDLATIDDEIASRELGPIVASPIRELGEPTMVKGSAVSSALRGLALGVLIGILVGTVVAVLVRRRQLWRS